MNRLVLRVLVFVLLASVGSGMLMIFLLDYQLSPALNSELEDTIAPGLEAMTDRLAAGEREQDVLDEARLRVGDTLAVLDLDLLDLSASQLQRVAAGETVVIGTGLDRTAYRRIPGEDRAVEFVIIGIQTNHLQWANLPGSEALAEGPVPDPLTPLEEARLRYRPLVRGDGLVWRDPSGTAVAVPTLPGLHGVRWLGATLTLIGLAVATLASLWPVRRQLLALSQGAARLRDGDLSARVPVDPRRPGAVGAVSVQFNAMADRVQDLIESHEELMRSASHELQTPLSRLMFSIEALEDEPPEHQPEILAGMRTTVEEMRVLANEILQFNRLAAGEEHLIERAPVDVAELAEDIALGVEGCSVRDAPEGAVEVRGDARLLYRALRNLVENAVAYADAPILRIERTESEVQVHVDDAGPGVPEAERERIFEPFHRVEGSRARATGGTGLGLAIVRRVAERHGGSATCSESPEGGARFTLRLPV